MDLLSHLEIKLIHKNKEFTATCDTFPKCKGVAQSQSEAIEKLSHSISRFVSTLVKRSFNSVLTSDNYTEIVFDESSNESIQKRVFQMDQATKQLTRSLYVKANNLKKKSQSSNTFDLQALIQKQAANSKFNQDTLDEDERFSNLDVESESDTFVFGFPLSFN